MDYGKYLREGLLQEDVDFNSMSKQELENFLKDHPNMNNSIKTKIKSIIDGNDDQASQDTTLKDSEEEQDIKGTAKAESAVDVTPTVEEKDTPEEKDASEEKVSSTDEKNAFNEKAFKELFTKVEDIKKTYLDGQDNEATKEYLHRLDYYKNHSNDSWLSDTIKKIKSEWDKDEKGKLLNSEIILIASDNLWDLGTQGIIDDEDKTIVEALSNKASSYIDDLSKALKDEKEIAKDLNVIKSISKEALYTPDVLNSFDKLSSNDDSWNKVFNYFNTLSAQEKMESIPYKASYVYVFLNSAPYTSLVEAEENAKEEYNQSILDYKANVKSLIDIDIDTLSDEAKASNKELQSYNSNQGKQLLMDIKDNEAALNKASLDLSNKETKSPDNHLFDDKTFSSYVESYKNATKAKDDLDKEVFNNAEDLLSFQKTFESAVKEEVSIIGENNPNGLTDRGIWIKGMSEYAIYTSQLQKIIKEARKAGYNDPKIEKALGIISMAAGGLAFVSKFLPPPTSTIVGLASKGVMKASIGTMSAKRGAEQWKRGNKLWSIAYWAGGLFAFNSAISSFSDLGDEIKNASALFKARSINEQAINLLEDPNGCKASYQKAIEDSQNKINAMQADGVTAAEREAIIAEQAKIDAARQQLQAAETISTLPESERADLIRQFENGGADAAKAELSQAVKADAMEIQESLKDDAVLGNMEQGRSMAEMGTTQFEGMPKADNITPAEARQFILDNGTKYNGQSSQANWYANALATGDKATIAKADKILEMVNGDDVLVKREIYRKQLNAAIQSLDTYSSSTDYHQAIDGIAESMCDTEGVEDLVNKLSKKGGSVESNANGLIGFMKKFINAANSGNVPKDQLAVLVDNTGFNETQQKIVEKAFGKFVDGNGNLAITDKGIARLCDAASFNAADAVELVRQSQATTLNTMNALNQNVASALSASNVANSIPSQTGIF